MIKSYEIEQAIPEIEVSNLDMRFTSSNMIPRVIVDLVYKDRLRTHFIYLDVNRKDDREYILNKVIDSIKSYISWFDLRLG